MTDTILPNGRRTDRLAFGCSSLGGSKNYSTCNTILRSAWEAGFRHFDVAPSYGLGEAEHNLGRFLNEAGARDATITSKVGISKPSFSSGPVKKILEFARPLLNHVPALRQRLGKKAYQSLSRAQFSPGFVEASLDNSLRALRRDHIDVYLLHECTLRDLNDELLSVLDRAKSAGKIGCAGIGSRRETMLKFDELEPGPLELFQTAWRLDEVDLPGPAKARLGCYGLMRQLGNFLSIVGQSPEDQERLERTTGMAFRDSHTAADMLIATALCDVGVDGLVIIQSSDPERVRTMRPHRRMSDFQSVGRLVNQLFRNQDRHGQILS